MSDLTEMRRRVRAYVGVEISKSRCRIGSMRRTTYRCRLVLKIELPWNARCQSSRRPIVDRGRSGYLIWNLLCGRMAVCLAQTQSRRISLAVRLRGSSGIVVLTISLENDPYTLPTNLAPLCQLLPSEIRSRTYPLNMLTARAASSTAPNRAVPNPLGRPSALVSTLWFSQSTTIQGSSLLSSDNQSRWT